MSAEALLSKLQKVRSTGRGTWLACCPAHDDRSPSMTIRETDDGRVLFHCFAGCTFEEIISASGVDISELFPPKTMENAPSVRRIYPAHDVLQALGGESQYVAVVAANMADGYELTDADRARLIVAHGRIIDGMRLANG